MESQRLAIGISEQAEPQTVKVFLCYRRADGTPYAGWLYRLLNAHIYNNAQGVTRRIECYFDQTTPGVPDWKAHHLPSLQTARAFVVICTHGIARDFSKGSDIDWAYREIRWWIEHRDTPPIVIDTTGEGERWVPEPILQRWPDLNRLSLDRAAVAKKEEPLDTTYAEQLRARIVRTIEQSDHATTFQDLLRYKKRTRQLAVSSALLAVVMLAATVAAAMAYQNQKLAEEQREIALSASRFITGLFTAADPDRKFGESLTAKQLLATGRATIDQPRNTRRVKASLLQAIGSAYIGLGDAGTAVELLERAERQMSRVRTSAEERFRLVQSLGEAYLNYGDYPKAARYLTEAVRLSEEEEIFVVDRANALVALGDYHVWATDKPERAEWFYKAALACDQEASNQSGVARDYNRLGIMALDLGNTVAARTHFLSAIRTANTLQGSARKLLLAQYESAFAALLYNDGHLEEAQQLYKKVSAEFTSVYGEKSGEVAINSNNRARILIEQDDFAGARPLLDEAVKIQQTLFGPQFAQMSYSLNNLGLVLRAEGNRDGAREHFEKAYPIARDARLGIGAQSLVHLAELSLDEGRLQEAARLLESADAAFKGLGRNSGWRYAIYQSARGELEARRCNFGTARGLLEGSAAAFAYRWTGDNLFKRAAARRQVLLERLMRRPGECK